MKILVFLTTCAAFLCGLVPCQAAERVDAQVKRQKARKESRKAVRKAVEAQSMRETARTEQRLIPDTGGTAGKISDQKPEPSRLDHNLARRMRELFKFTREKVGKKRDLLAETEAAERKARAEERARAERYRIREKRKVDLTVLFQW